MGQPKLQRKHFQRPSHPWQGDRIKAEHELRRKFGLKNKSEIWKAQTRLREIRGQARELISRTRNPDDRQAHREAKDLLARLHRQGYVDAEATLNEVLGLDVERILNRRLQSQVYLKGMARTMSQARQFVSHGSIRIGDRRVTVPSYVVRRADEGLITFDPRTAVADEDHPVRPKPEGYEAVAAARAEVEAPLETEAPAAQPAAPTPVAETTKKAETPPAADEPAAPVEETTKKAETPPAADEPAAPVEEKAKEDEAAPEPPSGSSDEKTPAPAPPPPSGGEEE